MSTFKYEIIFRHFAAAIEEGILKEGAKLDSLRRTTARFGCSLSVAMRAYDELELRGLVRAVEKAGYFVASRRSREAPRPERRVHALEPLESRPSPVIGTIMAMARDRDFLPLGATIPDLSLLPARRLASIIAECARTEEDCINRYAARDGEPALREELARLMLKRGVRVDPAGIVVTNGCTEALHLAIEAVSRAGENVAIESPAYPGLITMLKAMDRRVVEIPARADSGIDLDGLETVLGRTAIHAAVVSPRFQNPLASSMDGDSLSRLCALATRHDFAIIEDDTYGDAGFGDEGWNSAKSLDRDGRVLYCSSLSKTLAPGLRVGWMVPGRAMRAISEARESAGLGGASLVERAVARFLREGRYERHMKSFRRAIERQTGRLGHLAERCFPPGTRITSPSGGYFLWLELPGGADSMELFRWAYERKIGVIPGPAYSASGKFRDCLRLGCGSPVTDRIEEGMAALGGKAAELAAKAGTSGS